MVHESVMVCVDTSEWMRNGDLSPNRFCSEQEAVRALVQHKLRTHPENAVGLIAMAENVHTLSSVTRDDRNLIMKINSLNIKGDAKVYMRAMKTAYLALRHRPNPHSKQRIVMFIGSPLDQLETEYKSGDFIKLAKKYKKEKLAIDFVLFGEAATDEKNQIIIDFVDVLNGKDQTPGGSHVINVLGGGEGTRLFDVVLRSDICRGTGDEGAVPQVGLGGDAADLFGMDDEDPELAMALRISLEESRQQFQQQQAAAGAGVPPPIAEVDEGPNAVPMEDFPNAQGMEAEIGSNEGNRVSRDVDFSAMTEEEQMEYALRMSLIGADGGAESGGAEAGGPGSSSRGIDAALLKPTSTSSQQDTQQGTISSTTATAKTSGTQSPGTPNPTPMEVDGTTASGSDVLGQLIQQPDLLKKLVEEIPTSRGGGGKSAGDKKGEDEEKGRKKGKDEK